MRGKKLGEWLDIDWIEEKEPGYLGGESSGGILYQFEREMEEFELESPEDLSRRQAKNKILGKHKELAEKYRGEHGVDFSLGSVRAEEAYAEKWLDKKDYSGI